MSGQRELDEAAAAIVEAIMLSVADVPDDVAVPIGRMMVELGDELGVDLDGRRERVLGLELEAGEIRRRSRNGIAALSAGTSRP